MGTNVELSDVRIVKNADGAPQPIDDQSLDRVAGGRSLTMVFPNCSHTVNDPSGSFTMGELLEMAYESHRMNCT